MSSPAPLQITCSAKCSVWTQSIPSCLFMTNYRSLLKLLARLMNFKVTGDCFLKRSLYIASSNLVSLRREQRLTCWRTQNIISMQLAESQRWLQFLKFIWTSTKVWYWGCCHDCVSHDKCSSKQRKCNYLRGYIKIQIERQCWGYWIWSDILKGQNFKNWVLLSHEVIA